MTSLWPLGDGWPPWASEKPPRDAGSGREKRAEDLGSKDPLLPTEAVESIPRHLLVLLSATPSAKPQARSDTTTRITWNHFSFVRARDSAIRCASIAELTEVRGLKSR